MVEIMIVVAIIGLLACMAVPSFIKARNTSQQNACINNLRMIESGKEQGALAQMWSDTGMPINTIVNSYIRGNTTPECPAGGVYTYNQMRVSPSCSFVGSTTHRLLNDIQ